MTRAESLSAVHAASAPAERVWTAAEFAALLESPLVTALAAAESFALIRCVADEAELLLIATDRASQRQGHARRRLEEAIEVAKKKGAYQMFLEVAADNVPAQALYRSAGFRETGRRRAYYPRADGAVDALVMQTRIIPLPG